MSKDGRTSCNFGVMKHELALHRDMSVRPVSNSARKHALCITDIVFPTVPCYLLVRLQRDICHDVVIVFQHGRRRPRYLLGSSFDRLVYTPTAWYGRSSDSPK